MCGGEGGNDRDGSNEINKYIKMALAEKKTNFSKGGLTSD